MKSSEETEEDDVKDDDWQPGSVELVLETEGESVEAENGAEVVDSGVDESKEERDKMEKGGMEDGEDVADNDNLSNVFEEKESRLKKSTSERSALRKKAKVIIERLPEHSVFQAQNGRRSNCMKNPLEDYWCQPVNEREQTDEGREEHSGLEIDEPPITAAQDVPPRDGANGEEFIQSGKGKDGQREIQRETENSPRCPPAKATSASRVVNRIEAAQSLGGHEAAHSSFTLLLLTETQTGSRGDMIDDWAKREDGRHTDVARSETNQPCTSGNIWDVTSRTITTQTDIKAEILQTKSPSTNPAELGDESRGHTDASTSDSGQLREMRLQTRLPQTIQAKGSSHSLEMVEGPSYSPPTSTDLDTMGLDHLKREKIKRQLKVLKLQEEYYTLKIKNLKKLNGVVGDP
ncbi:hypothetical protein EXN66_Car016118 [Channa argus]|uniref:Uncharacterized protein n=1 Tax=Channa argus TaxID=215402 RepID=A0A6G1QCQ0_CHAAH|nr:hypothetical protein EXN66_Car016118 [Channa argus]